MTRTHGQTGRFLGLCAIVLATALGVADSARAQPPPKGEVRWVKAVTLSLRVGSTEQESKQERQHTPTPLLRRLAVIVIHNGQGIVNHRIQRCCYL